MKQHKKAVILLLSLSVSVLLLSHCVNNQVTSNDPRGPAFAGSAQCRQCHQQVYDSYIKSAHFNTTQPASKENVQGSFQEPGNSFSYNDSTYIQMQQRDSGLYQAAYINAKEIEAHRLDGLLRFKRREIRRSLLTC